MTQSSKLKASLQGLLNNYASLIAIGGTLCIVVTYVTSRFQNPFVYKSYVLGTLGTTSWIYSNADYPSDFAPGWFLSPPDREFRWSRSLVAVRSAYFHPDLNRVVLVTISEAPGLMKNHKWPWEHYCRFFNDKEELVSIVPGYFRTGYLFYCNNTLPYVPHYVYLYRNDFTLTEKAVTPWMLRVVNLQERKVTNHKETQDKAELALCMGPIMRQQNWIMFLQFFEYYRLHGVSKFILPKRYPLSKSTRLLLQYYHSLGIVEINSWEAHFPSCKENSVYHCGAMAQKAECVLKTSYFYKYVLLCDFDELLQPVDHNLTLLDFIRIKGSNNPTGKICVLEQLHLRPRQLLWWGRVMAGQRTRDLAYLLECIKLL